MRGEAVAEGGRLLDLVSGLYAAAADPALWPDALRAYADAFGAQGSLIYLHDKTHGVNPFSGFTGLDPERVAEFDRERAAIDPRVAWAASHRGWTSLYDYALYDESEMDREPYYAWLGEMGLRYVLGVPLVNDDHLLGMATIQRTRGQGHVSRAEIELMERLTPHLRQAVQLSMRFGGLELHAAAAAEAAEGLPIGLIVLDEAGRVLHMNREARRIVEAGGVLRAGTEGLRALRAADDAQLGKLIAGARAVNAGAALDGGGAMALPRPDSPRPYTLLVTPLARRQVAFALARPAALLTIADPERRPVLAAERLRSLWGLTPAEARLASELAQDVALKDAAERLGVAERTARVHLNAVLRKTGARRQTELVRLLLTSVAGLAPD
jgi:DNA-binding CsgD family transcriptional regulator